jgi:hypothetical protein
MKFAEVENRHRFSLIFTDADGVKPVSNLWKSVGEISVSR